MPKYKVTGDYSGYSRGVASYVLEAENEDHAKEFWFEGEEVSSSVVRDDTEFEPYSVELIEEK